MNTPLVNILNFNGMTKYVKKLLLGTTAHKNNIYSYTRAYIYRKGAITKTLPDHTTLIHTEDYRKEVKRLR